MEVVVIRWENDEWGIAYRDPEKGHVVFRAHRHSARSQSPYRQVRKEWEEKEGPSAWGYWGLPGPASPR